MSVVERQSVDTRQATLSRRYTVAEFDRLLKQPERLDHLLELIDGEIVEKMPTEEHGFIAGVMITALNNFALPKRLGIAAVEARHQVAEDEQNSRIPDVSFSQTWRPLVREGSVPRMPDLAIEIKSPNDTIKGMRAKAEYYLANGVRLVWLVYPRLRFIEVYRPERDVEILFGDDLLIGDELLPGFSMRVADVFLYLPVE